jgi:nucleoside-diphosphate-sugar epimerase
MTIGKLLLTGSNGFLGKNIDIELTSKFHVCGLSRTSGKYIINLVDDIPEFNEQFALVIHAAGKSHANLKGTKHSDDFYNVNVQGTQNLLKGLEKIKPPKAFIFISSVAVYGINEGNCIDESAPLLAKDLYGRSKIQAEHLILNWCRENNVTCTILRLPIIAGLNPPGNLGAMINGIKKGFYFNIAGGSAKKSMVLARDVAKVLLKASEVGGIYNLTDGYHPSFFELSHNLTSQLGRSRPKNIPLWIAKMFALGGDLIGVKAPLNSAKLKKITATLTFDDSKARDNFGWDPTPILEGFSISDTNK